jgi:hypothetical protein
MITLRFRADDRMRYNCTGIRIAVSCRYKFRGFPSVFSLHTKMMKRIAISLLGLSALLPFPAASARAFPETKTPTVEQLVSLAEELVESGDVLVEPPKYMFSIHPQTGHKTFTLVPPELRTLPMNRDEEEPATMDSSDSLDADSFDADVAQENFSKFMNVDNSEQECNRHPEWF